MISLRLGRYGLVAIASLMTLPASADTKLFSGGTCHANIFQSTATIYTHSWSSGILNYDTTRSLAVSCPIVRDNTTSDPTSATVWVKDPHDPQNVSCRFLYDNGTTTTWAGDATTSGFSSSLQPLSLPLSSGHTGYTYIVNCTLPPFTNPTHPPEVGKIELVEP